MSLGAGILQLTKQNKYIYSHKSYQGEDNNRFFFGKIRAEAKENYILQIEIINYFYKTLIKSKKKYLFSEFLFKIKWKLLEFLGKISQ